MISFVLFFFVSTITHTLYSLPTLKKLAALARTTQIQDPHEISSLPIPGELKDYLAYVWSKNNAEKIPFFIVPTSEFTSKEDSYLEHNHYYTNFQEQYIKEHTILGNINKITATMPFVDGIHQLSKDNKGVILKHNAQRYLIINYKTNNQIIFTPESEHEEIHYFSIDQNRLITFEPNIKLLKKYILDTSCKVFTYSLDGAQLVNTDGLLQAKTYAFITKKALNNTNEYTLHHLNADNTLTTQQLPLNKVSYIKFLSPTKLLAHDTDQNKFILNLETMHTVQLATKENITAYKGAKYIFTSFHPSLDTKLLNRKTNISITPRYIVKNIGSDHLVVCDCLTCHDPLIFHSYENYAVSKNYITNFSTPTTLDELLLKLDVANNTLAHGDEKLSQRIQQLPSLIDQKALRYYLTPTS